MRFVKATLADVTPLLSRYHYLGRQGRRPGDPTAVFAWLDDNGAVVAGIVFTSPAARVWRGGVELSRLVRAPDVTAPMSQFIAQSIRALRCDPRYDYIVSYADSGEAHYGGVYQAANFSYLGTAGGGMEWWHPVTGRTCSRRAFSQRSPENKIGWTRRKSSSKFLYVYPLRVPIETIEQIAGKTRCPYPKPDL